MATSKPIRYVNDGEPLDEKTLNRSSQDVKSNLDDIYSRVDGYDSGTTEAISDRIVLRDNNATSKFGVPSDDQHPWRLNEFREFMFEYFEETDRSNTDPKKILNHDHLPKATTSTPGITKLVDSYKSSDSGNAPTASALGDFYRWLINNDFINNQRLPKASTNRQGIVQLADSCDSTSTSKAPTAKALNDCISSLRNSIQDDIGDLESSVSTEKTQGEFRGSSETPSGQGFDGWVKLPNGFILQFGTARTGGGGEKTITFPIAFTTNYSFTAGEGDVSGWNIPDSEYVQPTIYGIAAGASNKSSALIYGSRVVQYGFAPAPELNSGMLFHWIAFGI